jgi:hypothetical protein
VFLLLGFIFVAIALGTSWWGSSSNAGSANIYPGGATDCSFGGTSAPCTLPSALVSLYGSIGALVATALALTIVGAIFAFLGAFALNFGRWQLLLTFILPGVGFLLILAAVIVAPVSSPSAAGNLLPAGSGFWGSSSAGGVTTTWGAGAGWYVAIVSLFFLTVGALLYFQTRREPYTARELGWTPAMVPPPGTPTAGTMWAANAPPQWSPPPSGAYTPPAAPTYTPPIQPTSAPTSQAIQCRNCGMMNPPGATVCGRCQARLV